MVDAPRVSMPTVRVLLACSDEPYASSLEDVLGGQNMAVSRFLLDVTSGDAAACLADADVLVVETAALGAPEWRLVEEIRRLVPLLEIVAISSGPLVRHAVRALRSGVFAVLEYPVSSALLVHTIASACDRKRKAEVRIRQLNDDEHWSVRDTDEGRSQ